VFGIGFRAFAPPPPPPGTALCGNAVLGGLIVMFIGAPIGAIASSFAAAVFGGILDCIWHYFRRSRFESESEEGE
jgi:hypothetical protein